jgi:hypothetical protein
MLDGRSSAGGLLISGLTLNQLLLELLAQGQQKLVLACGRLGVCHGSKTSRLYRSWRLLKEAQANGTRVNTSRHRRTILLRTEHLHRTWRVRHRGHSLLGRADRGRKKQPMLGMKSGASEVPVKRGGKRRSREALLLLGLQHPQNLSSSDGDGLLRRWSSRTHHDNSYSLHGLLLGTRFRE